MPISCIDHSTSKPVCFNQACQVLIANAAQLAGAVRLVPRGMYLLTLTPPGVTTRQHTVPRPAHLGERDERNDDLQAADGQGW